MLKAFISVRRTERTSTGFRPSDPRISLGFSGICQERLLRVEGT